MKTVFNILSVEKLAVDKARLCFNGKTVRIIKPKSRLYNHENNTLSLLAIETPNELCRLLKTSFNEIEYFINNPSYASFQRPKKKGGYREISAPSKNLKRIQKRLNYYLQAYYLSIKPKEVHGFVINPNYLGVQCNIANNAKVHVGKKTVLNIDLQDFFPNIRAKQVKELFCSDFFNFNEQIANALTLLTTFNGRLPIGAPTSPVLSNFICSQLDADLVTFCKSTGLCYSRYADDLTFSSDNKIPIDTILDLINLIRKNNFTINKKKLRVRLNNQKQTVTGIIVNKKINADRKFLKKVRAMLHDLSTNGIDCATLNHFHIENDITDEQRIYFLNRLRGFIEFIGQIKGKNDNTYINFMAKFNSASKLRVV